MYTDYWRQISGYPGYKVSRRGEVLSLNRNKQLSPSEDHRGYWHVNLYRDGRPRNFLVHRLVAAAFMGAIPLGLEVNHRDGIKSNNELPNLEIVTREANRLHAKRNGLMRCGERNHKAKLTEARVREIRRLRTEGARVQELAWRFGVSEKAVYEVCRRLTWRHVA